MSYLYRYLLHCTAGGKAVGEGKRDDEVELEVITCCVAIGAIVECMLIPMQY